MCADDLRKILREEYGILDDEEFENAVNASVGIDIGIFTKPFGGGTENDEESGNAAVA